MSEINSKNSIDNGIYVFGLGLFFGIVTAHWFGVWFDMVAPSGGGFFGFDGGGWVTNIIGFFFSYPFFLGLGSGLFISGYRRQFLNVLFSLSPLLLLFLLGGLDGIIFVSFITFSVIVGWLLGFLISKFLPKAA
ncbi:MAG: hypothetical protein Q7R91_03030 [bacterium]|nr:hypothetical protein [bacterium]